MHIPTHSGNVTASSYNRSEFERVYMEVAFFTPYFSEKFLLNIPTFLHKGRYNEPPKLRWRYSGKGSILHWECRDKSSVYSLKLGEFRYVISAFLFPFLVPPTVNKHISNFWLNRHTHTLCRKQWHPPHTNLLHQRASTIATPLSFSRSLKSDCLKKWWYHYLKQ